MTNTARTNTTNPSPLDPSPSDNRPHNVHPANKSSSTVQTSYDVCVVGGGIHGVGVAQAAAAAGYKVALLEKSQLAEGTSSRSSKLIHGGLRYLEQMNVSLVWESLRERELLFRIAPSLVKRQRFFIPVYQQTSRKPWVMKIGLLLYTILAGGRRNTWFKSIRKSEWGQLDGISTDNLKCVLQYWDGQTDDAALTRAVMQSAQDLGADLFCPAQFSSANITDDDVEISFEFGSQSRSTRAKVLINAAGPWANQVLDRITPKQELQSVDNVQGTHIELPGTIQHGCYYVEAPDRRVVFVLPWKDRTLVGTTEADFDGDPDLVKPLDSEIQYLVDLFAKHFPGRDTTVINQWTGLRVLPAATGAAFKRSRETHLPVDNPARPRLLSIYGGKLTGYRATALKVMRVLTKTLPKVNPIANTRDLLLSDPYQGAD